MMVLFKFIAFSSHGSNRNQEEVCVPLMCWGGVTFMWLGGTWKKSSTTSIFFFLNTRKICNSNAMVGYLKLAGLGLDVCESAGKAKSHPGVITQLSGKGVL